MRRGGVGGGELKCYIEKMEYTWQKDGHISSTSISKCLFTPWIPINLFQKFKKKNENRNQESIFLKFWHTYRIMGMLKKIGTMLGRKTISTLVGLRRRSFWVIFRHGHNSRKVNTPAENHWQRPRNWREWITAPSFTKSCIKVEICSWFFREIVMTASRGRRRN